MDTSEGLRARKKKQTRSRLLDAALDLFEDHGFESTTVEAITAKVGVSRRTFFRYFETKESLAFPEHESRQQQFLRAGLGDESLSSPQARAIAAFQAVAALYQDDPSLERRKFRIVQQSKQLQARQWQSMQSWEVILRRVLIGGIEDKVRQERLGAMTEHRGRVVRFMRSLFVRSWFQILASTRSSVRLSHAPSSEGVCPTLILLGSYAQR